MSDELAETQTGQTRMLKRCFFPMLGICCCELFDIALYERECIFSFYFVRG